LAQDHEAIDELLAGYVLRSLTGEDAREADRLLSDHVPGCAACRSTLRDFQSVMGELALGADALPPPEMLLPRLHREMGPPVRRRRPLALVAAAASVVAVVGLAGLTVAQGMRASDAQESKNLFEDALSLASRPDASQVPLTGTDSSASDVTEIRAPGVEVIYLVGHDIPMPGPGMVYRVWLGVGTSYTYVSEFLPEVGTTVLRVQFNAAAPFDRIVITEEPESSDPSQPSETNVRWSDAA
jgi:hypothetical protein